MYAKSRQTRGHDDQFKIAKCKWGARLQNLLPWQQISQHVWQIDVPTNTLPPESSTNLYLIAEAGYGLLVDPGSNRPEVGQTIQAIADQLRIELWIGVMATHYHHDHTDGLGLLSKRLNCPAYLHKLEIDKYCAEHSGEMRPLELPDKFQWASIEVSIQHSPGHTHGHVYVQINPDNVICVGDHLSATGTVWVGPPDGHMDDFYESLEWLIQTEGRLALPGHGHPISHPQLAAQKMLDRRLQREQDILKLLVSGEKSLDDLQMALYPNLPTAAKIFAKRTLLAHLVRLESTGEVKRSFCPKNKSTLFFRTGNY